MHKSESEISKEISDFLDSLGVKWHWRNQVYKGRVKSGAYLHTGKKGIADRIIVHWNRTIFLEIKDYEGVQSDDQIEFEEHCNNNNQDYWVCDSLESFIDKLVKEGLYEKQ